MPDWGQIPTVNTAGHQAYRHTGRRAISNTHKSGEVIKPQMRRKSLNLLLLNLLLLISRVQSPFYTPPGILGGAVC